MAGACMEGGVCMKGGACMAGDMHERGSMHGRGVMCGWRWGCVAGETATAADGTHPTGMHTCLTLLS